MAAQQAGFSITGSVALEARSGGRVWVAGYRKASTGKFTRKVLGPAWARDSGRRTARDAVVWRAAPGSKQDGYLTPQDAEAALERLLEAERAELLNRPAPVSPTAPKTLADATAAWLAYVTDEKQRAPSTLRRYRGIVAGHLHAEFGAETPINEIDTARIETYRSRLLRENKLSRDSVRQIFVALNGTLRRARRERWITQNPLGDVEAIPTPKSSGDFNVLTPAQVKQLPAQPPMPGSPCWPGLATALP
jgi:hypothetical protein